MINGEFIKANHGIWKVVHWHLFLTSGFVIDAPKQMGYAILFRPSKLGFVIIYVWVICPCSISKMKEFIILLIKDRHSGPCLLYTYSLFSNNSIPATTWQYYYKPSSPGKKKSHTLSVALQEKHCLINLKPKVYTHIYSISKSSL